MTPPPADRDPDRTLAADAALAGDLVRAAGALALRMRTAGLSVEQKTSASDVVTAADHAAERLIVERLRDARPDDGILGEEGAAHAGTSGRMWVIDPVDGTYNYAHGLDWWCSALALTVDGVLALGAVHHAPGNVLWVGGPDHPPTRNGEPMAPLPDVPLAETCATTYLHPPFMGGPASDAFARAAAGAATLRMLGSGTMDAMAVAQGDLGVRFQHSVADWDRLPGEALVRGLGGAAREVEAGGVSWHVLGAPTAVAEVCAALTSG